MTTISHLLIATTLLSLLSCKDAPSADKATTTEKQSEATASGTAYTIDPAASNVVWVGTKPTGRHTGTLSVNSGTLSVADGTVKSGNFVIDIASLSTTDLQGEDKGKLDGHLKSPDFFDAAKFPTASFTITSVEAYDSTRGSSLLAGATHFISGNLKLKDSTKNVTFPAKVTVQGDVVTAAANFNIDRTQWGMHYGSDASLQDKFIRPEVNLQLNIQAKK